MWIKIHGVWRRSSVYSSHPTVSFGSSRNGTELPNAVLGSALIQLHLLSHLLWDPVFLKDSIKFALKASLAAFYAELYRKGCVDCVPIGGSQSLVALRLLWRASQSTEDYQSACEMY